MPVTCEPVNVNQFVLRSVETTLTGRVGYHGERRNRRLRLVTDGDLAAAGVTIASDFEEFETRPGRGEHVFSMVVPADLRIGPSRSLRGAVVVRDVGQGEPIEVGRVEVSIGRLDHVTELRTNETWAFDLGGSESVLARLLRDGPSLLPGFPTPTGVSYDHAKRSYVLQDSRSAGEPGRVGIGSLKRHVHDRATGPPIAHPSSWADVNRRFLSGCLLRALGHAGGVPSRIILTVPASWTDANINHYRAIYEEAMAEVGMRGVELAVVNEATAAAVGTIQQMVQHLGGSAARLCLLARPDRPIYVVTLDVGSETSDVCIALLQVEAVVPAEPGGCPRFEARLSLRGSTGSPIAGRTFTRLIALWLRAQVAAEHPDLEALAPATREDIRRLARGEHPCPQDPGLGGHQPPARAALDAIERLVPLTLPSDSPHSRRPEDRLNRIAEDLLVGFNTPDASGRYPAEFRPPAPTIRAWRSFVAQVVFPGQGPGPEPPFPFDPDPMLNYGAAVQRSLLSPAVREILGAVRGMGCLAQRDRERMERAGAGPLADPRVSLLCLSGRGSQLRELRDIDGEPMRQHLPRDHFDLHASRLLAAREPKLGTAEGACAAHRSSIEPALWRWRLDGMTRMLPFELVVGTAHGDVLMTIDRCTELPARRDLSEDAREYVLYRRDHDGADWIPLGTLVVDDHPATPNRRGPRQILIDEDRRFSLVTPDRSAGGHSLREIGRFVPAGPAPEPLPAPIPDVLGSAPAAR